MLLVPFTNYGKAAISNITFFLPRNECLQKCLSWERWYVCKSPFPPATTINKSVSVGICQPASNNAIPTFMAEKTMGFMLLLPSGAFWQLTKMMHTIRAMWWNIPKTQAPEKTQPPLSKFVKVRNVSDTMMHWYCLVSSTVSLFAQLLSDKTESRHSLFCMHSSSLQNIFIQLLR